MSRPTADLLADPVLFTERVLRTKLWAAQRRILEALARFHRVSVKACHASGKTFVAACAALWFITRYSDGVVITTAPTGDQVRELLWAEIHAAIDRSILTFPTANLADLHLGPKNYAVGRSTDKGVRFQGFHGRRMLIIVDEAPGVQGPIFEGLDSLAAGGDVTILELGNPIVPSGAFYDTFGREKSLWHTITIGAFDTPNLAGLEVDDDGCPVGLLALSEEELGETVETALISRRWVKDMWLKWGQNPQHPLWQGRVLGQFPTQAEDALLPLAWLDRAQRAWQEGRGLNPEARLVAGVDVAGAGEAETALHLRTGARSHAQFAWPDPDPRGLVAAELTAVKGRLARVCVDSIGVGYNFGLHLRDLAFPVRLVNVGEPARDGERFVNLKAELYWALREVFEEDVYSLDPDDVLFGQLSSIRYDHDPRGRVRIESKEAARKRGVQSPDRAEALMLSMAANPAASTTSSSGTAGRRPLVSPRPSLRRTGTWGMT